MEQSWTRHLPKFISQKLEGRHELQKVLSNTGWLFGDKILRMGVGLLVGVWVARYLGPAQYGILNYAASFVALFSAVALLGLDSIVIRDLVRNTDQEAEILGTTFFLRLIAGMVSYLAAVVTVFIIRPNDSIAHLLVGVVGWVLIFGAFDTIDLWFQSKIRSKFVVYAKNAGFLVAAILRIGFIVFKLPVIAFAVANTLEIGLGALGLVVVYRINGEFVSHWRRSLTLARKLVAESWPLLLSGIVYTINLRIDQVILGQISDARQVGLYAAAVRIAEIWFFIPTAIVSSVFPNIIRAKESDEVEFYRRLQRLYNLLVFMGYAVAIPVSIAAGLIINLLFGKAYAAASLMLVLLVWSDIFISLAVARYAFLTAMNWTRILFSLVVVGAAINVLLNFVLIPKFGGVGAALASLVSYWAAAHGVCYLVKPLRRTARMMTQALLYPKFW